MYKLPKWYNLSFIKGLKRVYPILKKKEIKDLHKYVLNKNSL